MKNLLKVVEHTADEDSSSEEEEEEEEEDVQDLVDEFDDGAPEHDSLTNIIRPHQNLLKIKIKGASGGAGTDVARCKVCGATDHRAGFAGATYVDCPNKPCYLCKLPGHTTVSCPFKVMQGHGCTPAYSSKDSLSASLMAALRIRELGTGGAASMHPGIRNPSLKKMPRYQVDAAIYKILARRCCSLEFHPSRHNLVISGDKKGGVAIWDFDKVHERTVYSNVHSCLCNQVKVLSWVDSMACCTSSSDGTVKLTDLDTGFSRLLVDLNPQGWTEGGPFSMVYGCTADASHGTIYAGDSDGRLHMLDPRSNNTRSMSFQAHKKDKIVSVDVHPLNPNIIMTAGNDRSAKLFDVRAIPWGPTDLQDVAGSSPRGADVTTGSASGKQQSGRHASASGGAGSSLRGELANMVHTKVVNSAYFSPITGRKILTTCQDNRIRVWDNLLDVNSPPSREIVHSNDFNRYLTPFRAEWDPKDYLEERFIVGRYISEDYNGKALHPIDIMDASTACLLQVG
ncbi:hypothetical protein CEUSTIGMA_g13715.t1 [Chlamydomonas eustigma]|uniref:Uncharacterized protein n=1 Tax=Chlamydomonas eustigma TaxID=1157962 RepID=A0A250XTH1_9CHLO|nr:hypothetical protein CEUSTIGMA_g13715.t1 [Chlamydomonas eustigma]|eukprot:GAX86303.1 hypothetical protein CEUSTIGMA_g13715.t1 [Chlamydomonas eustigma]